VTHDVIAERYACGLRIALLRAGAPGRVYATATPPTPSMRSKVRALGGPS